MTNFKAKLMKVYWAAGAVFFSSVLLVRCGVDPTASSLADSAPLGATYASANFDKSRPFVSQVAVADPGIAASRKFISDEEALNRMLADLRTLDRTTQLFTRYITLTAQWNGGAPDDKMAAFRNGVSKTLNHLSYEQQVVAPRAIDQEQVILRFDLRAYGWSRGLWEEVVRRDPYAFFTGLQSEREINARTQVGRRAFVRGDWLAFAGLQNPLYNIIMRIPGNIRQLEFDFGVDADRDVLSGNVLRSAFSHSDVSSQNRMIEAHRTRFGTYWKSFDFEAENGRARRNLFEFALDGRFFGGAGFDFAAGEMIFQLPNGFALYMLADNQGRRLEKAITNVVQDPVRNDANVTNAVSCFRCHWKGMIPAIDEIRPHFEKNAFAFTRREVDIVRSLYAPQDQMTKAFQDYDGRFAQAVGQLGFPYTFSSGETEPVTLLAKQFEGEIPLSLAAAELGLTVNQFQTLMQRTRFLTRRIGNVNNGSTIKRAVFEDNFGFIVDAFGLGRPFFFRQFGLTDAGEDDGEYTMSAPAEENKVSEPAE